MPWLRGATTPQGTLHLVSEPRLLHTHMRGSEDAVLPLATA